ncbi:hypothetical protein ABVV53_00555 [Novosphingobium sp. RD2P27]|uniref:Multidrug transporter n=1 Tax=Novosphingobium kalidii TaxID=3230299 RepID=A0ABV2CWY0_9SPHN
MTEKSQSELSQEALSAKKASEDQEYLDRQTDTPDTGAVQGRNPDAPVDGALNAEGHRPVVERTRKER